MRNRIIVGVSVMIATILTMVWIYFDKTEKRMTIRNSSKSITVTETICADKRALK